MSKIPGYFKDLNAPQISYSYTSCIAPKIFNYKKVLDDVNNTDLLETPPTCSCEKMSQFVHKPAKHIITGNLDIVNNDKLKQLLSRGPKYREPRSFS